MKKLQIGLIATGGRGVHGFEAHRPEQGIEIVAGADINPAAQEHFKEKFPDAETFTGPNTLNAPPPRRDATPPVSVEPNI